MAARTVIRAYERRLDTEITHPIFGYKMFLPKGARSASAACSEQCVLAESPE